MLPNEIGLFAARRLAKDTIIAEAATFAEVFHPWSDYYNCDRVTQGVINKYCIQDSNGFYTTPNLNWLPLPWHMNHRCDYNVGFDQHENFVTTRLVARGEELGWDYGMGISAPHFRLRCLCKAASCRKMITGNDWTDPAYRERNARYFSRKLLQTVGL